MNASLFEPLTLRETTIPNRVIVSPMCQYSCDDRDGLATDWHHVHLGSRAVGGAGVVIAEATAVEPRGRISPEDLGIWSQEHADALAPTAEFIREQGSVPAIQLAHAGRKASTRRPWEDGPRLVKEDEGGWTPKGPSDEPYPRDGANTAPTERMDQDDIEDVIDSFVDAAEYALDAGFEVPEIHAAHGYLLHEFLSPVSNDRDDAYGGDFEGRTKLLREVCEGVREVWPDGKPIFVRISATDWLRDRDSWDVAQSARLASELGEIGVDFLDVSSGGIHPDQELPRTGPGYQVQYAETIRETLAAEDQTLSGDELAAGSDGIAVGTVGGITDATHAEALVGNERADAVLLAREHLRDPYFTLHAGRELDAENAPEWPDQYKRA
ncbi:MULTISPECIES: NADH:flavin oxidoreductase/NADH oxidase [Halolamina]|uniref:2,4-dienoyl-CoA reductase n=1 Tax=Halolamina pelagica TaxID=699431 RepID=A0A1I5P0Q4_9EURY|nr:MULTISPECIES: NADH:flavin oxidoreductase/NADH oxidase [Halolamina]NHX36572.1 NADH:flavin oxidoreductase/NADH oxidase [Halolamina sp. R1-12]SFP27612.1 2,4-dienoyl-CoA reductase [Halolamina pelagica]